MIDAIKTSSFDHKDKSKKRNDKVLEFLADINYSVRLVGKTECPAIVVDECYCMNAYLRDNQLIFTDAVSKGNVILSFNINRDKKISNEEFAHLIESGFCRRVYRIKHVPSGLYLHGFCDVQSNKETIFLPTFAKMHSRIYFNYLHAEKTVKKFANYPLKIE